MAMKRRTRRKSCAYIAKKFSSLYFSLVTTSWFYTILRWSLQKRNRDHVSFHGVKRLQCDGIDHPAPSSAKVKERLELYLDSHLGLHGLFQDELYLFYIYATETKHMNFKHTVIMLLCYSGTKNQLTQEWSHLHSLCMFYICSRLMLHIWLGTTVPWMIQ